MLWLNLFHIYLAIVALIIFAFQISILDISSSVGDWLVFQICLVILAFLWPVIPVFFLYNFIRYGEES